MNKIFLAIAFLGTVLAFTGCKNEEDDLFDQSASERLEAAKKTYADRLTSAEKGWIIEYYPTTGTSGFTGQSYLLLADFNKDKTVKVAVNDTISEFKYKESTSDWDIIDDLGPVLSFSSYNEILHLFCSPSTDSLPSGIAESVSSGTGLEGDYEFVIDSIPENAQFAKISGKKRGTSIRMIRYDDSMSYEAYLDSINAFTKRIFNANSPSPISLNLGDSTLIIVGASNGTPNIYPAVNGDAIVDKHNCPYVISRYNGNYYFRFKEPFNAPNGTTVQEFVYDNANDKFVSLDNSAYEIAGYEPANFTVYAINANHAFKFTTSGNKRNQYSTSFLTEYNKVKNSFSKTKETDNDDLKLTLQNLVLTKKDSTDYVFRFDYKQSGLGVAGAGFKFNVEASEDGSTVKFTYLEPMTDGDWRGDLILNDYAPALKDFLPLLSRSYKVTSVNGKFDQTKLIFTAVDDPDFWFEMTYNNSNSVN